jgi:hypothetical protein
MAACNPDYPEASVADFESFYCTEDGSGMLWESNANCAVCGRVGPRIRRDKAQTVVKPGGKLYHVCSPQCANALLAV